MPTVVLDQPNGHFTKLVKCEQDIMDLLPFLRAFCDKAELEDRIVNISLVNRNSFVDDLRQNQTS